MERRTFMAILVFLGGFRWRSRRSVLHPVRSAPEMKEENFIFIFHLHRAGKTPQNVGKISVPRSLLPNPTETLATQASFPKTLQRSSLTLVYPSATLNSVTRVLLSCCGFKFSVFFWSAKEKTLAKCDPCPCWLWSNQL